MSDLRACASLTGTFPCTQSPEDDLNTCTRSGPRPLFQNKLPTSSDFLVGYATVKGFAAMRNTKHGSWYIQALVRVSANVKPNLSRREIEPFTPRKRTFHVVTTNLSRRETEHFTPWNRNFHGVKPQLSRRETKLSRHPDAVFRVSWPILRVG